MRIQAMTRSASLHHFTKSGNINDLLKEIVLNHIEVVDFSTGKMSLRGVLLHYRSESYG